VSERVGRRLSAIYSRVRQWWSDLLLDQTLNPLDHRGAML